MQIEPERTDLLSHSISVEVSKCGKYSQIHPVHSLFAFHYKNYCYD